ncbi:MAG TPA: DUF6069 family protein [Acidimicrobiales bacterium]|nr:DUF6069 family protein [Acidimicrobiales bacterium]
MVPRAAELVRLDFDPPHRPPLAGRVLVATIVAIVGSLVADAVVAALTVATFPSTKGYPHFRFGDYGKLTVVGVIIACIGWPIVARVTSAPRWLFVRLAVLVTIVLLLPDFYLLYQGQPAKAVAGLMVMHVLIAVVTYNALVRIAPVRPLRRRAPGPAHLRTGSPTY